MASHTGARTSAAGHGNPNQAAAHFRQSTRGAYRSGPPEHLTTTFQVQSPAEAEVFSQPPGQAPSGPHGHQAALHGMEAANMSILSGSGHGNDRDAHYDGTSLDLDSSAYHVHSHANGSSQYAGPTGTGQAQTATEEPSNQAHPHPEKRLVLDPPQLDEWRQKLFDLDGLIILTHEQYETYFPHVDNIYSHRSTQRYKRKPFVSHYYDCRLKGRPPGTPKSDDPNKKKRKRAVRELNQCDVKIKITEYSPGATLRDLEDESHAPVTAPDEVLTPEEAGTGRFRLVPPMHSAGFPGEPPPEVGRDGQKFWTIQRIGRGESRVPGRHKHDLARSDEVKKNSVMRMLAKKQLDVKKAQVQRKVSGAAAGTVKKHAKEDGTKLYAACYCPFSQRVWIALEAKNLPYQYVEMDPHKRPASQKFLEVNPGGSVPALREGDWACSESTVVLEYLEDSNATKSLLPSDARLKAKSRLWIHHINSKIVPAFYSLLRAGDIGKRPSCIEQLQKAISTLVEAADEEGPYFLGDNMSLVDVHLAPFALRLSRVLESRRGWSAPEGNERWGQWLEAIEENPHVRATTSATELYTQTADLLAQDVAASES